MKLSSRFIVLVAMAFGIMLSVTSCLENDEDVPSPAQQIEINSDQDALNERMIIKDEAIEIQSETGGRAQADFS